MLLAKIETVSPDGGFRQRRRKYRIAEDLSAPDLYLDLLKRCLTRSIFEDEAAPRRWSALARGVDRALIPVYHAIMGRMPGRSYLARLVSPFVAMRSRMTPYDPIARAEGRDWPADAETMIGLRRLDNIQACVIDILRQRVPGDLLEAGVWRGGASIFIRAVLKAYGDNTRTVWVADSFQGLPKPDAASPPEDRADDNWSVRLLAVSLPKVQANFARYRLLDDRVRFLPGWFSETLPGAPIERLAVLRIDGDTYQSTMDVLNALYDRVPPGGYVIVDDYGNPKLPGCRKAVEDYRAAHGVTEPITMVDWTGACWQRR